MSRHLDLGMNAKVCLVAWSEIFPNSIESSCSNAGKLKESQPSSRSKGREGRFVETEADNL